MDEEKTLERTISDRNGSAKVMIEADDAPLGLKKGVTYATANNKFKAKKSLPQMPNIGRGSNGFAGVMTLAILLVLAGIIIAFITLKY